MPSLFRKNLLQAVVSPSIIKASLYALVAARAAGALASSNPSSTLSQSVVDVRATEDELDEWLSALKAQPLKALKPCPISYSKAGEDPWYLFPDTSQLASYNETILLNMVVQMAEDKDTPTVIRAYTADYNTSGSIKATFMPDTTKASLYTTANKVLDQVPVHIHQPGKGGEFSVADLLSAGRQVKSHLASQKPSCTNNAIAFSYSQSSAINLFAGAEAHQHGVTSDVLERFLKYTEDKSISKTTVVQLCRAKDRSADYSIGIVASSAKNLDFVQEAVKT
jgi:hypothetical protein